MRSTPPSTTVPSLAHETLVIGISSSALFDTRESDAVYQKNRLELGGYVSYQIARENDPFGKGTAFPLIAALMRLNVKGGTPRVKLVVLSKNEPEAGLRVMNSLDHFGFGETRAAFTGGDPIARYCIPFDVSLFLSREVEEVKDAIRLGVAAGVLYDPPAVVDVDMTQVRIAFDWDGVLGSTESEKINMSQGLEAFRKHETMHEKEPLSPGPMLPVLRVLAALRAECAKAQGKVPPIEIALVTSRNPPAHKRVMNTLRNWGVKVDQMFLLGGLPKDRVLKVFKPHIFFDDQDKYAAPAAKISPTGLVPWTEEVPASPKTMTDAAAESLISETAIPAVSGIKTVRLPTKREFEVTCRQVLSSYMPGVTGKPRVLNKECRRFIETNRERSPMERATILERIRRFDIRRFEATHDPMLNRDRNDRLAKILSEISGNGVEPPQPELGLEI